MKSIQLTEAFFEGQISIEPIDGWLKPWRVPYQKKALFPSPDEALLGRMETNAGVRLRFKTSSNIIKLEAKSAGACLFDLTIDNELIQTKRLEENSTEVIFDDLPTGEKVVEIWFPQAGIACAKSISLDDDATAEIVPDNRLKWITYGSSITHCGAAHSPSRTWPATAARMFNLNLTTLGFGGNCHLEPMVAKMIRDLPADIITLKLGINVQGGSTLSPRTFKAAVIGLIDTIREKHPDTPIGVISPIISPPRESNNNAVGLNLEKMRDQIQDAVQRYIDTNNDQRLFYFSGLEIFGPELVGPRLPDDLHPDGDGYEIMGENVAQKVLPELLKYVN